MKHIVKLQLWEKDYLLNSLKSQIHVHCENILECMRSGDFTWEQYVLAIEEVYSLYTKIKNTEVEE